MRILTQPLLLHLVMLEVEMDMLVYMIHGAQWQPVMLARIVFGEFEIVAVQVIHLAVGVALCANHGHVFFDLGLHRHVLPPESSA
jgi:hypothetical protein